MNYLKQQPKQSYGFIYKYTSPSGKSYIGQTIRSLYERSGKDGINYQNCSVFYKAIEKYGFSNFKVEILAELPVEQLEEAEQFYILEYNTLLPNGYNYYPGGCGKPSTKKTSQIDVYDLKGAFIRTFDSLKAAANEYNIPWQAISQCIRHEIQYYKDKIYVYHGEKCQIPTIIVKTHGRPVGQFNDDGELIAKFNSANEAARAIGKEGNARNIRYVCEGKRKHSEGFVWKYLD